MTYIINQVNFFRISSAKNTQYSAKVTKLDRITQYYHKAMIFNAIQMKSYIILTIYEQCDYKYRIFALRKVRPYFQYPAFYQKIPIKSQIF